MRRRNWTKQEKDKIISRDEGRCVYCGKPAKGIDHVIPISEGGITSTVNGVCCCPKCNKTKHTSLEERWIIKGLARLFQHGEDISWVGGIRYEPITPPHQYAVELLYDGGIGIIEIGTILKLDINVVKEHLQL